MNTLTHRGYGRIYVLKPDDIAEVKAIIKELDEYEYEYLPKDFITTFDEYPRVEYIGKFSDLDMDKLISTCLSRGVFVWVFDSGRKEYPDNLII